MQTMFSVMTTDPSPTCGFLEVFRDESKHHAGDDKDEDEEDTNHDRILLHSSFNGLVLVVHVCECGECVCVGVCVCGCVCGYVCVCVCVWVVNV